MTKEKEKVEHTKTIDQLEKVANFSKKQIKQALNGVSFTGSVNIPPAPLSDYRKLKAVYFCSAEESMERCMFFSPSPTGDCTWRDRSFLESLCRKEDF